MFYFILERCVFKSDASFSLFLHLVFVAALFGKQVADE
jgi:hypothetical protein